MKFTSFLRFPSEIQNLIVEHVDDLDTQRNLLMVNKLLRSRVLFNGGYPKNIDKLIIEYPSWGFPLDRVRLYVYFGKKKSPFLCVTFGEKDVLLMPVIWNQDCHPIALSNPWNYLKRITSLRKLKLTFGNLQENDPFDRINEIGKLLSKIRFIGRLKINPSSIRLLEIGLSNFRAKVTDYVELGEDYGEEEDTKSFMEKVATLIDREQIEDLKVFFANHNCLSPVYDLLLKTNVQVIHHQTGIRSNFREVSTLISKKGIPSQFGKAFLSNILLGGQTESYYQEFEIFMAKLPGMTRIPETSIEVTQIFNVFHKEGKKIHTPKEWTLDRMDFFHKKAFFKKDFGGKSCVFMIAEEMREEYPGTPDQPQSLLYLLVNSVDDDDVLE